MKITFVPMNVTIDGDSNKSVLKLATENGVKIKSICKGKPSCAECRVKIIEGENNVLPPAKAELNLIGSNYFVDHRRLSCQMHCYGDVTLDLTEQLKPETATKKVRGAKKGTAESRAVQDTLLLKEKSEEST